MSKPSPPGPPNPLRDALHAQLRQLLAGDVLTPRLLQELEQTARLARQILAVGADPLANFPRPLGVEDSIPFSALQALPQTSETFAATVIREAVSAYTDFQKQRKAPRLPELTEALATAKAEGMTELAAQLEAEIAKLLGRGSPTVEDAQRHEAEAEAALARASVPPVLPDPALITAAQPPAPESDRPPHYEITYSTEEPIEVQS